MRKVLEVIRIKFIRLMENKLAHVPAVASWPL